MKKEGMNLPKWTRTKSLTNQRPDYRGPSSYRQKLLLHENPLEINAFLSIWTRTIFEFIYALTCNSWKPLKKIRKLSKMINTVNSILDVFYIFWFAFRCPFSGCLSEVGCLVTGGPISVIGDGRDGPVIRSDIDGTNQEQRFFLE